METVGLNRDFWRGRSVFVTGHTGFKGSWLILMLNELGAEVSGFSLPPPTDPSMFELLGLDRYCRHQEGDIRNLEALSRCLEASAPEVVIHMAAQSLVRASYENPVETYSTNVMGTVNLLEASRAVSNVRSIVVVTTDKCYENLGWVWGYRENDPLGGADPYSNSKAAAEFVVDSYRKSFFSGAGLASARAGNVIGGGDFAIDRLVPDAMRAFSAGESLLVRNPDSIRPWQHVLDPLHGYLLLAERLAHNSAAAEGWNFGPRTDESVRVREIVEKLTSLWGDGASWSHDQAAHPHEAATLKLDPMKARLELGWVPSIGLDDALRLTTEWFHAYHRGEDLLAMNKKQVRAYLAEVLKLQE